MASKSATEYIQKYVQCKTKAETYSKMRFKVEWKTPEEIDKLWVKVRKNKTQFLTNLSLVAYRVFQEIFDTVN